MIEGQQAGEEDDTKRDSNIGSGEKEREKKHDVILCICYSVNKHRLDKPQKTTDFASVGCMSVSKFNYVCAKRERETD